MWNKIRTWLCHADAAMLVMATIIAATSILLIVVVGWKQFLGTMAIGVVLTLILLSAALGLYKLIKYLQDKCKP